VSSAFTMDRALNILLLQMWVYGAILIASFAIAQATSYTGGSQLPWWAILVAFLVAAVLFPFFCASASFASFPLLRIDSPTFSSAVPSSPLAALFPAITGWQVDTSSLILMLGGAVRSGNTQANMCVSLF
jgi:hypothetical protein